MSILEPRPDIIESMETSRFDSFGQELLAMSQADQEMRIKAQNDMEIWDDSIDHRNTARLKEIVQEIGWPTIPKVGAEASQAA